VGRKREKTLQVLGPLAWRVDWTPSWKKGNRVQSSLFQGAFSRWTLKGVFPFFHYGSVWVPKTFAFFSRFLCEPSLLFVA